MVFPPTRATLRLSLHWGIWTLGRSKSDWGSVQRVLELYRCTVQSRAPTPTLNPDTRQIIWFLFCKQIDLIDVSFITIKIITAKQDVLLPRQRTVWETERYFRPLEARIRLLHIGIGVATDIRTAPSAVLQFIIPTSLTEVENKTFNWMTPDPNQYLLKVRP